DGGVRPGPCLARAPVRRGRRGQAPAVSGAGTCPARTAAWLLQLLERHGRQYQPPPDARLLQRREHELPAPQREPVDTGPARGAGSAGGSKVPARTAAAICSWASRKGTPSRTSASAASVAYSSGSAPAAASRSRSNSSSVTRTVRAASAPRTSRRAANTGSLS